MTVIVVNKVKLSKRVDKLKLDNLNTVRALFDPRTTTQVIDQDKTSVFKQFTQEVCRESVLYLRVEQMVTICFP